MYTYHAYWEKILRCQFSVIFWLINLSSHVCLCVCIERWRGEHFFQLNADFFNLKGKLSPLENQEQLYFFWFKEIAEKQRRQQLISRLPNIQCLNGTPISEGEREDAERAFLRLYMDCDEKPSRWENKLISRNVTILTLNARLVTCYLTCYSCVEWIYGFWGPENKTDI